MAGDRDDGNKAEDVLKCVKAIKNSQMAIIAGCYHVVLYCNFPAVWEEIKPFLGSRL